MNRNKSVIVQIYAQLLKEESLDPMVQRAILRYATAGKVVDLLTALAGRPDIDPQVDAALGKCDIGKVRVAWMGHPRRDLEVAREALRKEKRTGVLSVLAATPALSEEDYRVLAETGQHKVCYELIINPDVSDAVKQIAATGWGASIPGGTKYKSAEAMRQVVGSYPELVPFLLSEISAIQLVGPALESALNNGVSIPAATSVRLVKRMESHAIALANQGRSYGSWYSSRELDQVITGMRQLLGNPGVDTSLVDTVRASHATLASSPGFEKKEYATKLELLERDLTIAEGAVAEGSVGTLPPAAQARLVTDPEKLREFANAAALNSDAAIAASLMANPASPPDVLERVIGQYDRSACARLVQARAEEIDLLTVVLSKHTHLISDELLARSGDPEAVLISILDSHQYTSYFSRELWESGFLSERVLEHVPLRAVAHGLEHTAARAAIQRMLIHRLGESGEHWGLLESLSESFEGNLGQLLLVGEATLGRVSFQPTADALGEPPAEEPADEASSESPEAAPSAETQSPETQSAETQSPDTQSPETAISEAAIPEAEISEVEAALADESVRAAGFAPTSTKNSKRSAATGGARGRRPVPSNALQGLLFEMV